MDMCLAEEHASMTEKQNKIAAFGNQSSKAIVQS
jgi:hypothetical protein